MLWLALHLPLLSLEAFCATLPKEHPQDRAAPGPPPAAVASSGKAASTQADGCGPVALLADHRITSVNTAAAALGVRPGFKRATALALAPQLLLGEASAGRDAAALQALAHAALAFTPAVTGHGAQTVLLDVTASLRLFGGLAALQKRLVQAVAPLGHRLQMAAAPTALGAALLARWGPAGCGDLVLGPHATQLRTLQALLADAPVWLLGPAQVHWESLQGMGLHTLSDLRQLPRSGLARRCGEDVLQDMDRALGLQPDPRQWLELPAVFDSRLELFARAETSEQVLHGAAVLLARLVAWAQARHARVASFTLRMLHERQRQTLLPATELHVPLAEPALDAAHLHLLLRERLGRLDLAAPTLELQLQCSHLVAGHAPNGELFPNQASRAEGLTRLLDRLRARLGDAQVQRIVAVADHRPERASRSVPALGVTAGAAPVDQAAKPSSAKVPPPRPAWLLPEPLRLAERNSKPLLQGRVLPLLSGPERIEAGWWDGDLVARDYYIAQDVDGSLLWLYRSRLPALTGEVSWFLQGRFA